MAVSDYLKGTGTQTDPYVIHNAIAWKQFFNIDKNSGFYFELSADIDMQNENLVGVVGFKCTLNGNGYTVKNFNSDSYDWFGCLSEGDGSVENLHVIAVSDAVTHGIICSNAVYSKINNCKFEIRNKYRGLFTTVNEYISTPSITNTIIILNSSDYYLADNGGTFQTSSVYLLCSDLSKLNVGGGVKRLLNSADSFNPLTYPALSLSLWYLDGVSIPRLIHSGRPELTQSYAIKGKALVGGVGKKRQVRVLISAYIGLVKSTESASNGDYLVILGDIFDPVIVLHHDVYGFPFSPNKSYVIGDVIHPATPNGYAYDCTTAGVSSSTEPTTWPTSGYLTTGAAIFTPRPIYKPESHLVQPVKIDLLTGLPA